MDLPDFIIITTIKNFIIIPKLIHTTKVLFTIMIFVIFDFFLWKLFFVLIFFP